MKLTTFVTSIAIGLVLSPIISNPVFAGTISDPNDVNWASIRGLSSNAFGKYFQKKKSQGYRVIDIEVDKIGGQTRYSAIYQKNIDKRGWASLRNLTHEQFSQRWKDYRAKGYRLIDQEAYKIGSQRLYAGVWEENKEKLGWVSYRNVDSAEFSKRFKNYKSQGYRIVDVEAYPSGGKTKYSAIWVKNTAGLGWAEYRDMSKSSYASKFKEFKQKGYRVLDIESYKQGSTQKYAAIWVKNTNGRGWAARRDMDANWFGNWWKTYKDEGYRLVDFEAYPTAQGTRYAGVWRQNGNRLNWSGKTTVDNAIKQYKNENKLAGISVAIARNGKIIYSRGFGFADIENKKVYSADTVSRHASVSKLVTALLTMRLLDLNQISLDKSTRSYVSSLPNHHTHTVEQLMRHRSGIRHYRGSKRKNCEVPNNSAWKDSSNTQYSTATQAATLFQSNPLMFSPGSKRCYTTHGYTVLGAALEGATNKSFSGLINREINQRLNIPTLKPEFRNQSNPERAKIYSLSNGKSVPAKRDNLSWKYPGGGLESSAIDLTRLGMKVLDGSFVSEKSLNTYSTNNKLSHSGSQRGAKSYWWMNRSDKTVISVLTNQSSGNPGELTKTIEGILQKN